MNGEFDATRGGFGYEKPNRGESVDWWTPPEIVQALGHFDLDPCAGVGQIPLADKTYVLPQNGLALPWHGRVFCNPPYGNGIERPWAEKLNDHGNGILLIYARTETVTWSHIWLTASAILFPFRRIVFCRPDGTKPNSGTAPSAFVAYGDNNVEALRHCNIEGALVTGVELVANWTGEKNDSRRLHNELGQAVQRKNVIRPVDESPNQNAG